MAKSGSGKSAGPWKLTITLANGQSYSVVEKSLPKYWKSWLNEQVPYDENLALAEYKAERIA